MTLSSDPIRALTWRDFDDFWRELESAHEQTPYTFDAYDEEVARIAFKAGRESMLRQMLARLEHMLELSRSRGRGPATCDATRVEAGRVVLRQIAAEMRAIACCEDN